MSDQDLLLFLIELDKSDLNVSKWEAGFIDSVLRRGQVTFTPRQRSAIVKMTEKYDRRLP